MQNKRRSPVRVRRIDPRTCTGQERLAVLARAPFFSHLDDGALADVDARCQVRNFDTGEVVYRVGQPARWLYVVAHGAVKLSRTTADGRPVMIDLSRHGHFLGALPAFGEDQYPETAQALTPVCLLALGTADFNLILRRHPTVARAGLEAMGRRLRQAQQHIAGLSSATAERRVSATLLTLADRVGVHGHGRVRLQVPLSRDDLAGMAGTASETVSRVLAGMQRDGVVDTGRQWVEIRDLDRLKNRSTN